MTEARERDGEACVLLSCAEAEVWAVPQIALATLLHRSGPRAPLAWRGLEVPVLDRAAGKPSDFSGPAMGELFAVFQGGPRAAVPFWALRLRTPGARWVLLSEELVRERPDAMLPDALVAFEYQGEICQIPDLAGLGASLRHPLSHATKF